MSPDLPKTTIKFLTALLKHQAKLWLGEETVGIAAETLIDEDLQKRLDDWLNSEASAKELLKAAEQAQIYLQDPTNCPDVELRHLFRDFTFGDLPSVQTALTELPQAMDAGKLTETLHTSFTRDLPNLSPAQCKEGARLYTDALLRAVGTLEKYVSPILLQTVLDLKKGQHSQNEKLDKIISILQQKVNTQLASSPTKPGDLPIGSYVPFPQNKFFTGRVDDLEKLKNALLNDSQTGVVINQNQAVTGMGGLGKTQLAVEFAYHYGYQFKGVHWLDLREAGTLDSQIALCGSKMGIPLPPTLPEQVEATKLEWIQNGPRLLILDNFEDETAVNDVLATLSHSNLRLLITSRRADWHASLGLNRLPLDEFSEEESLAFLRQYIKPERESDEELKALSKHLGYLPLALELAGRYLEKQPRLKIEEYLTQLNKALEHRSMQNWKVEQRSLTGHDLSLAQTFAQSWGQVTNPVTQKLFICLGYCAPNTPIPYEILDCALGDAKDSCDECLNELLGLGLLKEGNSIHPLLAEYARGLDSELAYLKPFCEAASNLANQTNADEGQTGNYSLYIPVLPHIRTLAENVEVAIPEQGGSLWNSIGIHIYILADYAGAKAAFERALKIDETAYGLDHPNVAIRVNNLGEVLRNLGDYESAKAALERALKIDETAFGPDHPIVAIRVNNLGEVLRNLGDYESAKAAFERALKIDETAYGLDHPNVAIRVNNLGEVLRNLGDYESAKAAFERALQIDEAAYGLDHPDVATDVNNLGMALKDFGDLNKAKAAYERAIKIWETSLGSDHPQVATGVNNLGLVLQDLGDLKVAKAAFERALEIDEANFGPDHPNVAIRLNNLGTALQALGEYEGAKTTLERALKILEKFLPPEHPNIKIVRRNLDSLSK